MSRVCIESGCPELTEQTRCPEHRRERERDRGTAKQRGYGAPHVRLRAEWQRRLDAGERVLCWRCLTRGRETVIDPRAWHLGHNDADRSRYEGPECIPCNTATAARR